MKKLAFLVLPAFLLLNACTGTTEGAEKYAGTYTTNYVRYCTGSIPACNETGTRSVEVIKGGPMML